MGVSGPIIIEVTAFPYWLPTSPKPQLVVRVRTADGITGWGEAGFTFRELAVAGAVDHLRDLIVGQDSFRIGALWQEMYRRHYFEGCRATSAAMSAIDVALHDIKARALGIPLYELLGGHYRDRIEGFATTLGGDADAMVASARGLRERGFDAFRLHILPVTSEQQLRFEPREAIALTAAAAAAVRAELGDAAFIGIDFHHRLSSAEAISFAQRLPAGCLDFLEEPIRAQSLDAYRTVAAACTIPLAIGEEFTSKWEFMPVVNSGILGFARIDLANVGGLTEAMKIAGACEARYIDVMPHNPLGAINTAATLHFSAAIPNCGRLEVRQHHIWNPMGLDGDLFPHQPLLKGAAFDLPDGPGLGIEVNEAAVEDAALHYRLGHHDRLIRNDGGLTNF